MTHPQSEMFPKAASPTKTARSGLIHSRYKGRVLSRLSAILILCGLTFSSGSFANCPAELQNGLQDHPSAYLAMHASDPVHWQPWSSQALACAQQHNRPLLISSGYFACHWCHVMQDENYTHSATAELINRHFIPVKLDRELHSDLDDYLIAFSRQITGQAGWPLHVLLTPEGYPFAAFGYLPNPDFQQRLTQIHRLWNNQQTHLTELAQQQIRQSNPLSGQTVSQDALRRAFFNALEARLDDFSGGLKGSLKFPNAPLLNALVRESSLSQTDQAWLKLTLKQMRSHHLYDHIHDGFYRYTTDPEWQHPHFEKMLYDNAQLAQLYFLATQRWPDEPLYRQTAEATLNYLHNHLFDADIGLFKSSQSALDSRGREGGAYLFNAQQLQQRLSSEAFAEAYRAWQLNSPPPYELGWHPKPTTLHWNEIRAALTRSADEIPTDHKYILGWNGLMLSAYVSAYRATQHNPYLQRARQLATRLIATLGQTAPPRALDAQGQPIGAASLEDYAYVIQGLRELQAIYPERARQTSLEHLVHTAKQTFRNPLGWQTHPHLLLPGQQRQLMLADTATPSPGALLDCLDMASPVQSENRYPNEILTTPLLFASYLPPHRCRILPSSAQSEHKP